MMEKRKYARLNIEATVKYKISGQRQKNAESAKCDNISPEGLCLTFHSAAGIKIGTRLDMEVILKGSNPFHMIGEVIWVKDGSDKESGGAKVGVKILEIDSDDENRFLLQLCDRMVQKLNKDYLPTKLQ